MTDSRKGHEVRSRRVRAALAVCAAAVALAAPAASAQSLPVTPGTTYFGFNDASALETRPQAQRFALTIPESVSFARQTGANTVRYPIVWSLVEPSPGRFNWSRYDQLYATMVAKGVRPILLATGSPAWARGGVLGDDAHMPMTARYENYWVRFLYELTRRYPKAAAIEMWNEPNLASFFRPGADPQRYTRLLCLGWYGSKVANAQMPVLLGGLSGLQTPRAGDIPMVDFLQRVYSYGGAPCFDAVGYHAHTHNENRGNEELAWARRLQQVRTVLAANGESAKHVWMTEAGYTTAGGQGDTRTEAEQASLLVRMVRWHSQQPGVDSVIVHSLMPFGDSGSDGQGYSVIYRGLLNRMVIKPAFCALALLRRGTCAVIPWATPGIADPPPCGNGRDDDADKKTDYPDDPGCSSRLDVDER